MKHFVFVLFVVLASALTTGCEAEDKADRNLEPFYGTWEPARGELEGGGSITLTPNQLLWGNGDKDELKVIKVFPRSVYVMTKSYSDPKEVRYYFTNLSIKKGEDSWNKDSVYLIYSSCSTYGLEDAEHFNMAPEQFWQEFTQLQTKRPDACPIDEKGFPISWSTTGYKRPASDFNPEIFE